MRVGDALLVLDRPARISLAHKPFGVRQQAGLDRSLLAADLCKRPQHVRQRRKVGVMAACRQIRLDDQKPPRRGQEAIGGMKDRAEVLEVLDQEPHHDQIEAAVRGVLGEVGQSHGNIRVTTSRDGDQLLRDVDAEIALFRKKFVEARYVVAVAAVGIEHASCVPPSLQRDKKLQFLWKREINLVGKKRIPVGCRARRCRAEESPVRFDR